MIHSHNINLPNTINTLKSRYDYVYQNSRVANN